MKNRYSYLLGALLFAGVAFGEPSQNNNLLHNPSFELQAPTGFNHASYWTLGQPSPHGDIYGSASREDWRSFDGLYIMTIRGQWAEAGDQGGCWQEALAEPGVEYTASGWYWADPGWEAGTQEMKLEFWSADHEQLIDSIRVDLDEVTEEWQKKKVRAVAPDQATYVRLVVHAEQVGYSGALQFDHMVLARSDEYQEPPAIPVDLIIDILE